MTLSEDQKQEIVNARSKTEKTLRASSAGMEEHLYNAHEVLDHGWFPHCDRSVSLEEPRQGPFVLPRALQP